MDKTSLVDGDISRGRRFVDALRRRGLPVAVAMWFRKTLSDRWNLGIASSDVQDRGPLSVLILSDQVREAEPALRFDREDILYFNTSSDFMQDIARFPGTVHGEFAIVDGFSLGGVEIERAVVFWIDPSQRPIQASSAA